MADEDFTAFVRACGADLQRAAWLLTGDWALAEDLVQTALARTWPRWRKLREPAAAQAYVRRAMYRTFLGWRRRRWQGELPTADLPEHGVELIDEDAIGTRSSVHDMVRRLPPRQRAVVVLRYFEDLSERATADALGCSVGNVKSQASRALAALRAMPEVRGPQVEELW